MVFTTELPHTPPDADTYSALKGGLHTIDHQPATALPTTGRLDASALTPLFDEQQFQHFVLPRLHLAATGQLDGEHLSRFPGTHVPDLGNDGVVRNLGALALARFIRTAHMQGGVCDGDGDEPFKHIATQRAQHWPWSVDEPVLQTIVPASERLDMSSRAQMFLGSLERGAYSSSLDAIQRAWSPYTSRVTNPEYLGPAQAVLKEYGRTSLPLAFELQERIAYAHWLRDKKPIGRGIYRGCWLEVYPWALKDIRNTELAQTPRVLSELHTLIQRGFAPIVINEYGANVDGTHRQTASWIWNLLHHLEAEDLRTGNHDQLNLKVSSFVAHHGDDMGPVMLREVLRIFAEFLADTDSRTAIIEQIFPQTRLHPAISVMPVIPLLEQTWPTVRYHEYIGGARAVRVDPVIYLKMQRWPNLVLPAHGHGPYHLTDRALVPWFNVLVFNSQL